MYDTYIYIYIYTCICVCIYSRLRGLSCWRAASGRWAWAGQGLSSAAGLCRDWGQALFFLVLWLPGTRTCVIVFYAGFGSS